MAFKMKGFPMQKGTTVYKSALKHNAEQLQRAQERDAKFKHDESTHDHPDDKEIWYKSKTVKKPGGGTETKQEGEVLGKTGKEGSKTCPAGFHMVDGKCIKDEPTRKSDFDFKKECYDKNGKRVRNNPKCKWADETETDVVTTEGTKEVPDKPLSRESSTPPETKKPPTGCVEPEGGCPGKKSFWDQELCKCRKPKIGKLKRKPKGKIGKTLQKAGKTIKRWFKRNDACDGAYSDASGNCLSPEAAARARKEDMA